MSYTKIKFENAFYFHLHAEEVIMSCIDSNLSLSNITQLRHITLESVSNSIPSDSKHTVILDFNNLVSVQYNTETIIQQIRTKSINLILLNISGLLLEPLRVSILNNPKNIINEHNVFEVYYVSETYSDSIPNYKEVFEMEFESHLIKHTKDTGFIFHNSSSVYINKYIDIKSFISYERKFFLVCIYFLSLQIKNLYEENSNSNTEKPWLVCQNLNSSLLTSVLSSILKWDLIILDKIGPINNLYANLNNVILPDKNYLVISDVICLGTEVKITKNLITYLGGNYIGNVSLVRVATLKEEDKYKNAISLYNINKLNNKIDLKISTSLNYEE